MTCRRAGSSSATVPSGSGSELKTSTCNTALATTTGTIRRGGRASGNDSSASGMNSATDHGHAAEYAVAQPRAGAPVARAWNSHGVTAAVAVWQTPAPSSSQPSRLSGR